MVRKERENKLALRLRRQGFSYREVLQHVPVAKSTLSLWLRSVGLSRRQRQRLTEKKLAAMRRGWETVHRMRMRRWHEIRDRARAEVRRLSRTERWLVGTALYWAEGAKEREDSPATSLKFSNSDFLMVLLFRDWLFEFLGVSKEQIRYGLYIHESANWFAARRFWAERLAIQPKTIRVYFKRANPTPKRKNVGRDYIGLMRLSISQSIALVRKVSGWIEGMHKNWGVV